MNAPIANSTSVSAGAARQLPSGRSVILRVADGAEEIEVRSAAGDVEVRIVLTDAGPVVRLTGANLELEATDTIRVQCSRFEVATQDGTCLQSDGQIDIHARGDVDVQGKLIKLNS
jgi:hypothetical protein